ncbi:MAG: NAD-dependent epimerase/dehydratase family protein [Deltaproteobacteria bacterium]|nr:NAD-dependent epimerase/dehydratase family protein [Deltaproteobacteria bacterium]
MTQAPETPSDGRVLLITGAAGFIGANACRYFSQRGWQVVALPAAICDQLRGLRKLPKRSTPGSDLPREL